MFLFNCKEANLNETARSLNERNEVGIPWGVLPVTDAQAHKRMDRYTRYMLGGDDFAKTLARTI